MSAAPERPPRRGSGRAGRRLHDGLVVAVALVAFASGLAAGLRLTLIPLAIDEQVQTTSRSKDGPPYESFWAYDRGAIQTYAVVIDRLGGLEAVRDQPIRKDAWDTSVTVGDRSARLTPPVEFWKVLAALAALLAVAVVRWWRRPPSARRTAG